MAGSPRRGYEISGFASLLPIVLERETQGRQALFLALWGRELLCLSGKMVHAR